MRPQIDFARSSPFQSFLSELLDLSEVNQDFILGVAIDFHPTWWRLATLWQEAGGIDPAHWPYPDLWPYPSGALQRLWPRPDPTWNSETWNRLCHEQKKEPKYPFLAKICLRRGAEDAMRERVFRFANASRPFFCTVEERPLARAAANFDGGRELQATGPGTLGGFLKDRSSSRIYGVTCAHVAQSAGANISFTLEDASGVTRTRAGTVAHSTYNALTALGSGQPCNRSAPGLATQIDVALVELDPAHTELNSVAAIGTVDEIFNNAKFGSGDDMRMRGAVSKHNDYYVGAYDAVYKVLFNNGKLYCFEHMFEISRQALVSSLLPPAMAAKAVQGDSGAWVCCDSTSGNFAYCGSLVAVDGMNGYACFAESVVDWGKTLSPALDLVPF